MRKSLLVFITLFLLITCNDDDAPVNDNSDTGSTADNLIDTSQPGSDSYIDPDDVSDNLTDTETFDIDEFSAPDDIGAMVDVPAGEFQMGCNEAVDTECLGNELPYHTVFLSAYRIGKYEVSAGEYRDCVVAGACVNTLDIIQYYLYSDDPYCNLEAPGREGYPMQCVTWYGAQAYCEYRGQRLPTEAEWEKAARGTDGRKYPWGDADLSCDYAVMADPNTGGPGCGTGGSMPVGSKKAGRSPYDAYDMVGNVWEWVNDWYSETYYEPALTNDPTGPDSGLLRALRGGAWGGSDESDLRASHRSGNYPVGYGSFFYGNFYGGFRCAE